MESTVQGRRPKVSVITAAFNQEEYIRDCVESVLAQSFSNLELIVIDDGSTDGTYEILRSVRDDRLRLVKQENRGHCGALNRALTMVRGEFVGLLDGDDLWARRKLERHLEVLEQWPQTDLSFSLFEVIDENNRLTEISIPPPTPELSAADILLSNPVGTMSTVVLRADSVRETGAFDAQAGPCADLDMWLRIARLRRGNVRCIEEVLTRRRRHSGQQTRNWRTMRTCQEYVLANASEELWVQRRARHVMTRFCGAMAYENGELAEACKLLLASGAASPVQLLRDPRWWMVASAVTSKAVLPAGLHDRLVTTAWEIWRNFATRRIQKRHAGH